MTAPWASPSGIATMIDATMTRQNVPRERASAVLMPIGRPADRAPRMATAIARLSTLATMTPSAATRISNPIQPPSAPVIARFTSVTVAWTLTISSAQNASA